MVERNITRISKSDSIYIKRTPGKSKNARQEKDSEKALYAGSEAENFKCLQNDDTPREKIPVYMRLDEDILTYFKSRGRGYQSRINDVLRMYINTRISERD